MRRCLRISRAMDIPRHLHPRGRSQNLGEFAKSPRFPWCISTECQVSSCISYWVLCLYFAAYLQVFSKDRSTTRQSWRSVDLYRTSSFTSSIWRSLDQLNSILLPCNKGPYGDCSLPCRRGRYVSVSLACVHTWGPFRGDVWDEIEAFSPSWKIQLDKSSMGAARKAFVGVCLECDTLHISRVDYMSCDRR